MFVSSLVNTAQILAADNPHNLSSDKVMTNGKIMTNGMTNGKISRGELYGHARKYATIVPVYTIILHCITFPIEYVPRYLVDV